MEPRRLALLIGQQILGVTVVDAPHGLAPEGDQIVIDGGAPGGTLRWQGKRIFFPLLARRIPRESPIAIPFATIRVAVIVPLKFGEDAEAAPQFIRGAVVRPSLIDAKQLVRKIGPLRLGLRLGIINLRPPFKSR